MSRRTDAIRSLFAAPRQDVLSADNTSASPRVASGAVRSITDAFSGVERENAALRATIAAGAAVVDVSPALIDPAPVPDRFRESNDDSFEALKASIAQSGQEVPVLLRAHPTVPGRFQTAYGHRRVRAAAELGLLVKAVVRALDDEQLLIAQGVENSARRDLSFIERAVFAHKMELAGHARTVVQSALTIDRAEASKLISVAASIPEDIIDAIGRAPKIGRGRWQALCQLLEGAKALARARSMMRSKTFAALDSDARFAQLMTAAEGKVRAAAEGGRGRERLLVSSSGKTIARLNHSDRDVRILIDRKQDEAFASFLIDQIPGLFERFVRTGASGEGEA